MNIFYPTNQIQVIKITITSEYELYVKILINKFNIKIIFQIILQLSQSFKIVSYHLN